MSKTTTAGWEQLNCPFFASACRRVLSGYLGAQGFIESTQSRGVGIFYRRSDVFLEISYEPISRPNYSPTVVLGIGPEKYDQGGPAGVPFWFVIPKGLPEQNYSLWTFKTEADLESVLCRVRDAILEPYALPLALSLDRLEQHIANFRARY